MKGLAAIPQFSPRLPESARLAAWATALMVVILGSAFAHLTWTVLTPAQEFAAGLSAGGQVRSGGQAKSTGLEGVAALHLFGDTRAAPQAPKIKVPIDAPETRLNLKLHGVIASADESKAGALIAEGSGAEKHYKLNDALPGGAVLKEVHTDRVLLQRNGRFETLRLPKELLGDESSKGPAAAASQPVSKPRGPSRDVASGAARMPGTRSLQAYRERLMKDPAELWKMVRLEPVMEEGGAIMGYKVSPQRDRALFQQLGLQKGDIVTAVNGIPMSDTSQMGQALSQLSTSSRFEITVERNGQKQTLNVDMN